VTVPEQGLHGVIEFANRMLTFVLLVVALGTLVAVWKLTYLRPIAIWLVLGIPAQAILGGFTVLTKLNPWLVGSHFILSGLLIATASLLVWRFKTHNVPEQTVPERVFQLAPLQFFFGAAAVVIGVLVTGAGPHSGDAQSARNGLNLEQWQHYHSWPAYILLALTSVMLFSLVKAKNSKASVSFAFLANLWLLALTFVQAVVGIAQSNLGVPPLLVALHMLGASLIVSALTFSFLASRLK
jgi:cytochrome c oxidase assembly protein subunit 15